MIRHSYCEMRIMQRRITSTGVIVVRSNWGWRNRMEDAYVLQLLEPKFKEFHLLFCGYAECEPLHRSGNKAKLYYSLCNGRKGDISGWRKEVPYFQRTDIFN